MAIDTGEHEMRCVVGVKRVIDFNVKPRVKQDKTGIETAGVKMSMNPFDEIAVEEAVRLKAKGLISEIIAVSIGIRAAEETCRLALARGADTALLVETHEYLEPLHIASIFKVLITQVLNPQPNLVLLGKQAIDDDCNQTGQMLSALLGWSQGTFVSRMEIHSEQNEIEVTREVDAGLEILALQMPAVITVDLRLNDPGFVPLPKLLKAKSKPLQIIVLQDLIDDYHLEIKPHLKTIQVEAPVLKRLGVKLGSVSALLDKLQHEAKVI